MPSRTRTGSQMLLLMLAENLLKNVRLEDFVMLSRNTQPTQYTGKNHNSKSNHGPSKSSPEYSGIESLEDLRREFLKEDPDWNHMTRCYLHLSSILRY